jgi:hypothetical protein
MIVGLGVFLLSPISSEGVPSGSALGESCSVSN